MEFNEVLGQYRYEYNGLIFVWEEEPDEYMDTVKAVSENYYGQLDEIIRFMLPDLKETYGEVSVEDVKSKLGKPFIDYDNGKVSYCEHTFDDCHIFEFEFLDDEFKDLQYFLIDG